MTKQKILQLIVAAIAVCGAVGTAVPQLTPLLPASWQPYGVALLGIAIGIEKVLISTNQILVGPSVLQSPKVQAALPAPSPRALPVDPADLT